MCTGVVLWCSAVRCGVVQCGTVLCSAVQSPGVEAALNMAMRTFCEAPETEASRATAPYPLRYPLQPVHWMHCTEWPRLQQERGILQSLGILASSATCYISDYTIGFDWIS